MAEKLPRVTAKIFASNAAEDDIGQYGSALAGNKVLTSDISEIQALPAYETGWRGAVLSTRNYPTLQEMNGLQKTFSQQIAYLLETGLPEWDENTTYWANTSFCQFDGKIYQSLTDNNIGNNPTTDTTNWQYINFNGANQDLSNLTDSGIDFINQSKAMYTGQVSDNPIVYADIEKAYHSSFDLSKFTVVGNPIITDDGIASGFNYENRIATTILDVTKENYCVKLRNFEYKGQQTFIFGSVFNSGKLGFDVVANELKKVLLYATTDGIAWDISNATTGTTILAAGTLYDISFIRENGNKYKVVLYNHSTNTETTEFEINSELDIFNFGSSIILGSNSSAWVPYTGSIDLKRFSVTVDGVEVFSGNKTGLDVITSGLQIPYTLTKGGAKIADMQYLERVQDAYEQGFTEYSYLTIDEENQKFTLPQGMSVYEGKGLFNTLKIISPLTPVTTYQSRTYDSENKSAEQYYGIIDFSDKNNVQTGRVDNWNPSATSIATRMSVFNPVSNKRGDIYVFADDNGETYATVPTPASTLDKSTKVATTEWVHNYGKPNLSAGVTIPYNTDYTCPTNGWWFVGGKLSASSLNAIVSRVIVQGNINGQSVYFNMLEVNSNLATGISTDSHQLCRVYAGDIIKLYTESSSNNASVASYVNIFYPDA